MAYTRWARGENLLELETRREHACANADRCVILQALCLYESALLLPSFSLSLSLSLSPSLSLSFSAVRRERDGLSSTLIVDLTSAIVSYRTLLRIFPFLPFFFFFSASLFFLSFFRAQWNNLFGSHFWPAEFDDLRLRPFFFSLRTFYEFGGNFDRSLFGFIDF